MFVSIPLKLGLKFRLKTICGSILLYNISIPSGTLLKAKTKMVRTCRWLAAMPKPINPSKPGLKMLYIIDIGITL